MSFLPIISNPQTTYSELHCRINGLTPTNPKMGECEWSRAEPNEAWLPKHANLTGSYKEEGVAVITQKLTGHSRNFTFFGTSALASFSSPRGVCLTTSYS